MANDGACSSSLTILEKLKMDCMLEVFSYLSVEDLIRSEAVSILWRQMVLYKLSITRTFTYESFQNRNKLTMCSLRQLLMKIGPGLHCLQLSYGLRLFDTPQLIAELCPNIQKLSMDEMTSKNWNLLSMYCKDLKSVSFSRCTALTDAHLSTFAPKLEELCISGCSVTGSFLLDYQNSRIRKLELSNCEGLKPELLCQTAGRLKHLTSLTLDFPSQEMYKQLHDILLQLPQLQEFSCCGYQPISDYEVFCWMKAQSVGSLKALCAMKDLRVLNLDFNNLLTTQILEDIGTNCTRLRVLNAKSFLFSCHLDSFMLPELDV